MNLIVRCLQVGGVCVLILFGRIRSDAAVPASQADVPKPRSCTAPEYRQFDFWVGDWDAFDVDNPTKVVASTRVELILDGCVLREDYKGADGHQGQSFSIYDASRKLWHQSWVTNRGELLMIEGRFERGEMVLSGVDHAGAGQPLVRGTWKTVNGGAREIGETSPDGGKTWKPWFDLVFRPHKQ